MFRMADRSRSSLLTIATLLLIFTFVGNGAYGQRNTVVYEGTENTTLSLDCTAGPNSTKWSVRPTSKANTMYTITDYDDTVASNFTGFYALNPSGLTVRNATTNKTDGLMATAGIYFAECLGKRTAAKFIVIRSGPTCSCDPSTSDVVNVTCTIIYADHPVAPINAVINWTINGQFYTTTTPTRTLIAPYVYNSTSTITVNKTVPGTYDCLVTFASPPAIDLIKYPFLAKNAPDFNASCTVACDTTTVLPATTTTTQQSTVSIITTIRQTTTTTQPMTTTTKPLSATTTPHTSANVPTTTIQPVASTNLPTTTTSPSTASPATIPTPSTTTNQPTTTTPQPSGASEIGLLGAKVALGALLGVLLAIIAAIGLSWCFFHSCPPLVPLRRPPRFFDGEMLMGQRREWIPVRREICQTDYLAIPFYQQSFRRYPTPYDYRLPKRCRYVQSPPMTHSFPPPTPLHYSCA